MTSSTTEPRSTNLWLQLGTLSAARTVINSAYRMVYPFLPAIARGLGVTLADISLVVTVRSLLGVVSPPLGAMSDRIGRKLAMLAGLGLFAASAAVFAIWTTYPVFFVSLLLVSAGKIIFDAAIYAYIGERVDYAKRGRAVAVIELGWSTAFLLGMPLFGFLIQNYGLRSPFPVVAVLALIFLYVLWRFLPHDAPHHGNVPNLLDNAKIVLKHPSALAGLAIGMLISGGNELVFIVYGDWMERTFDLSVTALGVASIVIGLAELGGEGLVAVLVDRIGKKRSVSLGVLLSAVMCILLPIIGQDIAGVLVGLFLFFIVFEFTLVSSIPLMTELVPDARATLMAGAVAAFALGRALGAFFGPLIYSGVLLTNSIIAAVLNLVALVLLLVFVRID